MATAPLDGSRRTTYRARWIVPVATPPLEGGAVTVEAGRILAVGPRVPESPGVVVDLGDVMVTPGWVNAHTHLDLSAVPRPPAPSAFADWLRGVIAARQACSMTSVAESMRRGADEVRRSGTVLVGDIAGSREAYHALHGHGLAAISFREIVGHRPGRFEPLWREAAASLTLEAPAAVAAATTAPAVASGLSPHAPYSTALEVFRRAANERTCLPIAVHWLEAPEEREFLETGGGRFRDFLEDLGALPAIGIEVWGPAPTRRLLQLSRRSRWLLIHGNHLRPDDIDALTAGERRGLAGVVYCPRTHAYFGFEPHPWRWLMSRGIRVPLGTDSRASNPDLSVYEEARYLAERHPDVDPLTLLAMATLEGARALGRDMTFGSLEPGKAAAMVVLAGPVRAAVRDALFAPETRIVTGIGAADLAQSFQPK